MKTITIWLPVYRPFVMGGSVHRIKKTTVPVLTTFEARGFKCACVELPRGQFRVASISAKGALVSDPHPTMAAAREAVENDIRQGEMAIMKEQVKSAVAMFDNREHDAVKPEEFLK